MTKWKEGPTEEDSSSRPSGITVAFRPARLVTLTKRGGLLLSLLLVGPVGGIVFGWTPAQVGGVCAAILLLAIVSLVRSYFDARRFLDNFSVALSVPESLTVTRPYELVLRLRIPEAMGGVEGALRLDPHPSLAGLQQTVRFSAGATPREDVETIKVIPQRRGSASVRGMTLRIQPRFALFQWQVRGDVSGNEIKIFPDASLRAYEISKGIQRHLTGPLPLALRIGSEGREFDSLRLYSQMDDLRRVDWKRSAKRASLVVKTYRPETHQRMYVALDTSRRMSAVIEGRTQLDYAIDAVAHVARLAAENDDEFGFFAYDSAVRCEYSARRGRRQEALIREALRLLDTSSGEPRLELFERWSKTLPSRSLIILVTSAAMPVALDEVTRVTKRVGQRHLPVVVAMRDRTLTALATAPATSLDEAFIAGAARDYYDQILDRIATLQHHGCSAVYDDALSIGPAVEKKYYQLKRSGRW